MPYYVIEKTMKALITLGRPLVDAKILVIGVAYKPDIDDMRESPALKVIDLLIKEGVDVSYYDPYIPVLPKTRKYELNLESVEIETLEDGEYDAGIIITNHTGIDYPYLLKKTKIMIDTRNALNQKGIKSDRIWKA